MANKQFEGHNDSTGGKDVATSYTIKDPTTGGVQVGQAMTADPALDAPDAFVMVSINGTNYQMPLYAA